MALKLFRSTGYSSILAPGETRAAHHPGWVVLAASLWAGFACNVAVWRALRALPSVEGLPAAIVLGLFVAGACGVVLSLLGWRKTLKPAATLLFLLAALSACAIWTQGLPLDSHASELRVSTLLFPPWPSFLRWQVALLLAALFVPPTIWVWNTQPRRLPGPRQLASNVSGMLAGAGVMAASAFLLFAGA